MICFQLRDARAEAYVTPFYTLTRAMAMREIQQRMERDKTLIQFAADFAIYEAGPWDQHTGLHKPHEQPIHVIDVIELVPEDKK